MKPHPLCEMHDTVPLYPEDDASDCAVCKEYYSIAIYCTTREELYIQLSLNNRNQTIQ